MIYARLPERCMLGAGEKSVSLPSVEVYGESDGL
jgi:hypothetical protein